MDSGFWDSNTDWIIAVAAIVIACLLAWLVDRILIGHTLRRAERLGERLGDLTISRSAETRIRIARRLIVVVIVSIGVLVGISQFDSLSRLTQTLLASSAVLGLVLGFAGRAALANPVAGIMMAVTQPVRIGDLVEFNDHVGRVEDLTLSYTFIRTEDGRSMIIPNEMLATGVVFNSSRGQATGVHPQVEPREAG